ncbi:hypothetical protein EBZ80_13640 [bacterium]|nr:hypothetical protein [bacterium]
MIACVVVVVFLFRMRVIPRYLMTYETYETSLDGIKLSVAGLRRDAHDDLVVLYRGPRSRGFLHETGLGQLVDAVVVCPDRLPRASRLRDRFPARRLLLVGEGVGLAACRAMAGDDDRVDAVAGCPAGIVLQGAPRCPVLLCLGDDDTTTPPHGKNVIVRRLRGRGWLHGATREILKFLDKHRNFSPDRKGWSR